MRGMAGDLQQSLGALIQQGKVRVTQSRRGIAVEISDSVLFTSAKPICSRNPSPPCARWPIPSRTPTT